MREQGLPLTTFYKGWDGYQRSLVRIIAPLSPAQLALRAAPHHWSIGMVVQHIVANRVFWFQLWMGEGDPALAPIASWGWGQEDHPVGSAAELVVKLEATWQMIEDALARWTPADLGDVIAVPAEERERFSERARQWIIWHVLEHEIYHGGELSLALGAHGLEGIYGAM